MMRVTGVIFLGYILVSALTDFSTSEAQNNQQILVPGLVTITASITDTPPAWAVMERHLIKTMEETAQIYLDHFARPDGTIYGGSSVEVPGGPNYDDLYEMFYNWPLFYAIGANEKILSNAIKEYNAVTRMCTAYEPNKSGYILYNEFPEHADWFHIGEGMQLFYNLGLAEPSLPINIQRAKRFAGLYMNEAPEAYNYDPKYKIIRGSKTGSKGPLDSYDAVYDISTGNASLFPLDKSLLNTLLPNSEKDWFQNKKRTAQVQKLYDRIVLPCDGPGNLPVTALMTNAYLYTGDEKYKSWVLEYVNAWMDRIKENNGILPDNIGRTGKIGEYRKGQWWGGYYGWTRRFGIHTIFESLCLAAECAHLLSGDPKYLDLLRSQIDILLENSITTKEGLLLVPNKYGPEGWSDFRPMEIQYLSHLWHASMDTNDWKRIERVKKGSNIDWNNIPSTGDRTRGVTENARLMYYAGENPDWPLRVLQADYREVLRRLELVQDYSIPPKNITQKDWLYHKSPVLTKGLLQVTMGAPQTIYNGGLLRARVRYFDIDRVQPGLPEDVAALVTGLEADRTVVYLVNLSTLNTHRLIVQAGAFGENTFTEISYRDQVKNNDGKIQVSDKNITVNNKYFAVELPPSGSITLDIGTKRFINKPTYAFPWHGGSVP